jgi:RNA polymerase subunit RPABC4/transcription elongation factor Spt4
MAVAIVPSPPGAYLIIIDPTKKVIAMKTAIGHPQRSV